jgi:hypothetical protein
MFETPEKYTYFHSVAKADTLLANPYFPHLIQKIKGRCGIKDQHYEALYEKLVPDFAAFVQLIPLEPKGKPGTLLTYSLERAANALDNYYQENKKEFDIRFAYAVFTAALFQNIGKVMGQQKITICDKAGEYIEDWLPHIAPMSVGGYYRLWFLDDQWSVVSKYSSLLLARQIMPVTGFNWISEDLPVYKMWLEALVGEGNEDENKLLKYLEMVDPGGANGKKLPTLIFKPEYPKTTAEGEEFLDWLIDGLDNGSITTNQSDSMVYILGTGEVFLVTPLIFNEFLRQHPSNLSWDDIYDQFNKLGMTESLKNGQVDFEKVLIQKDSAASQGASGWRASVFGAQKAATAMSQKVAGDQMVREGIVVQSLMFRKGSVNKSETQNIVHIHTEAQKQQNSKEMQQLDKLMQAQQKVNVQSRGG